MPNVWVFLERSIKGIVRTECRELHADHADCLPAFTVGDDSSYYGWGVRKCKRYPSD